MEVRKVRKISLEEYLQIFHCGKQTDISINRFNQILNIHGFRQIKLKKELAEAMDSLVLINLSRSTLSDDGVSSCASMNLEDTIADVNELNWKDCCITSFQTIDFSSDNQSTTGDLTNLVPNSNNNYQLETGRSTLHCSRKRKKGVVTAVNDDGLQADLRKSEIQVVTVDEDWAEAISNTNATENLPDIVETNHAMGQGKFQSDYLEEENDDASGANGKSIRKGKKCRKLLTAEDILIRHQSDIANEGIVLEL